VCGACVATEGIQDDDVDPEDLQPFPSLATVFQSVDHHTGFNIEIKYPQTKIVGHSFMSLKSSNYLLDTCTVLIFITIILSFLFLIYINNYIDFILNIVEKNHQEKNHLFLT